MDLSSIVYREPQLPDEALLIRAVIENAFGQSDEAELVGRLRQDGDTVFEGIAVYDKKVIGHIALSKLKIVYGDDTIEAAALAPVSVLPEFQSLGIGRHLTIGALKHWQAHGNGISVVLGHPLYYPQFGFSAELARRCLVSPFPDAGDAFMLHDPSQMLNDRQGGIVCYAQAFGLG